MSKLTRDVINYLESKDREITIDDIDTITEFYIRKPMLTAEWWKIFLKNRGQHNHTYFVSGQMLQPNDKKIHATDNLIERDKLIVIPIDNWISVAPKKLLSNRKKVENVLTELAKERMDRVSKLDLQIDDNHVQSEPRIISPLFEIDVNDDNINILKTLEVGHVTNGRYFALSDGYWLFIEPNTLSYGPHIIKTYGSCATGVLELQIHHTIHII